MSWVSMNFLGAEYQRHLVDLEGDLAARRSFAYDALILSQIFTSIKRGENKMKSEIDKSWLTRLQGTRTVGCKQGRKGKPFLTVFRHTAGRRWFRTIRAGLAMGDMRCLRHGVVRQ